MKRSSKHYIITIGIIFLLVVLFEAGTPRRVRWDPSFTRSDKIPYGAYILHDLLPVLFGDVNLMVVDLQPYEFLNGGEQGTTYIFVNSAITLDEFNSSALLEFVERGNTVFMATQQINGPLADSLDLSVGSSLSPFEDSTTINFVNPSLKTPRGYGFQKFTVENYFEKADTINAVALGVDQLGHPNFIRVKHGEGYFYLNTIPYAFTNYHLLMPGSAEYAVKALSYLPDGEMIWDEYFKDGKGRGSEFRYVLSKAPLRWALYLTLAGVLLFIIFMGRRRQRIIPEIKPLPNTTLEFVETVGQLYYQHGDHKNIAEKKITYFLEHIRSSLGVETSRRDEELYRAIAGRSGLDIDRIRNLFGYVDAVSAKSHVDEGELTALSTAIERYYRDSKR